MAELVDEQQFGLCEAEQLLVELLSAMRIGGAERHDGRELHRLSREDRLAAEHYGEVRWPTLSGASQQRVFGVGDPARPRLVPHLLRTSGRLRYTGSLTTKSPTHGHTRCCRNLGWFQGLCGHDAPLSPRSSP